MQHEQEDYTFSQYQYEDYLTLNGIVNRTGIAKEYSYTFVLKELLDNAVDDVEKSSNPLVEAEISIRNNLLHIVVRNLNESNKVVFSKAKLDSIFNLSKFTSSKRGLFRISRGALGDAMKYILGIPYALARELHVTIKEGPLTIRTNQQIFSVKLNVDKGEVKEEKQEHNDWTEVEVRLPIVHEFLHFKKIKLFLADYVLFSTHGSFKFRVGDETMVFSQTQPNNKKWVNNSSSYDIGFDDLEGLAQKGVDMLIIEKEGGAEQLAPLAAKKGIALLNARGFLVNYAIRLAEIAGKYGCNIAILSDLDIYGLTICSKIPGVYRIGISFETLRYFNLNLEDVEEEYNAPSFDMDFSKFATEEELEYLKTKRIEIDSVMIAVNDNQRFWEYILKKLEEQFPTRDYNRAIDIPEHVVPGTIERLNDMVKILSTRLTRDKRNEISSKYHGYEGFIDDVDEEEKANSEELKSVIEKDKQVMEPILTKIQDLINECGKKIDDL